MNQSLSFLALVNPIPDVLHRPFWQWKYVFCLTWA